MNSLTYATSAARQKSSATSIPDANDLARPANGRSQPNRNRNSRRAGCILSQPLPQLSQPVVRKERLVVIRAKPRNVQARSVLQHHPRSFLPRRPASNQSHPGKSPPRPIFRRPISEIRAPLSRPFSVPPCVAAMLITLRALVAFSPLPVFSVVNPLPTVLNRRKNHHPPSLTSRPLPA